jgi:hypothetical protein
MSEFVLVPACFYADLANTTAIPLSFFFVISETSQSEHCELSSAREIESMIVIDVSADI